MPIVKGDRPIANLPEWRALAPPKAAHQWAEGRSAMEAASFWLNSRSFPDLLAGPLLGHGDFGEVSRWEAEPEVRLRFDHRKGEPRNTDLLVTCQDAHGKFLLAVEAKADETFGPTVSEAMAAALERLVLNPRSRGVERIADLAASLLHPWQPGEPRVESLRYQLFTATAGALAEAGRTGADRVVVVVQEFRTRKTQDAKHHANARDLDAFVGRLTRGATAEVIAGRLAGPFTVPGRPLFEPTLPALYFLKAICDRRGQPPAASGL